MKSESARNILCAHWLLFSHALRPGMIPLQGKKLALFKMPFHIRPIIELINSVLKEIDENLHVLSAEWQENSIELRIPIPTLSEYIISGIKKYENSLLRTLPEYSSEKGPAFGNIKIRVLKDDIAILFQRLVVWSIKKLDIAKLELLDDQAIAGYSLENS